MIVVKDKVNTQSIPSFNLILIDSCYSLKISHPSSPSSLSLLSLKRPSIYIIKNIHFLNLAAGYPQAEQVLFCLWYDILPQRLQRVCVLVCLLPNDGVPRLIYYGNLYYTYI